MLLVSYSMPTLYRHRHRIISYHIVRVLILFVSIKKGTKKRASIRFLLEQFKEKSLSYAIHSTHRQYCHIDDETRVLCGSMNSRKKGTTKIYVLRIKYTLLPKESDELGAYATHTM